MAESVYRVYEVEIYQAQRIDEIGTSYTLTPRDPNSDDGRYAGEVDYTGRVFEFAPDVLQQVYTTQYDETAFVCRRLGEEQVFLAYELVGHSGRSIDVLIGSVRPETVEDEPVDAEAGEPAGSGLTADGEDI